MLPFLLKTVKRMFYYFINRITKEKAIKKIRKQRVYGLSIAQKLSSNKK